MALKFVHTADLHLDSPFVGLSGEYNDIALLLQNATFEAFNNIIELCLNEKVDFLLVAGDVYDGANRSLRAQLEFRKGLARLGQAGINSYVVHGNHDPLDGWSSSLAWPSESYIFKGNDVESIAYHREGVTQAIIHGVSFPHRDIRSNLAARFKVSDSTVFNVALLHCNVGTATGHEAYAPCAPVDLTNAGFDYWALGHVHSRSVLSESSPTVVYAGNPQGRHINESGARGCYLVEVSDTKEVKVGFISTDAVRWARHELNIEGLNSEEELLKAIENTFVTVQQGADGRPCICRLNLAGSGPLHMTFRRSAYVPQLLAELRDIGRELDPIVWVETIEIATRPPVDVELRRQSQDFLGDCLRLITEYRADPMLLVKLKEQLEVLYEDRLTSRLLSLPDDSELLTLIDEAEALCLDKLYEEEP